jgi:hypothetical protein
VDCEHTAADVLARRVGNADQLDVERVADPHRVRLVGSNRALHDDLSSIDDEPVVAASRSGSFAAACCRQLLIRPSRHPRREVAELHVDGRAEQAGLPERLLCAEDRRHAAEGRRRDEERHDACKGRQVTAEEADEA